MIPTISMSGERRDPKNQNDDPKVRISLVEEKLDRQGRDINEIKETLTKMAECVQVLTQTSVRLESVVVTNDEFFQRIIEFIEIDKKTNKRVEEVSQVLSKEIAETNKTFNENLTETNTRVNTIYDYLKATWVAFSTAITLLTLAVEFVF